MVMGNILLFSALLPSLVRPCQGILQTTAPWNMRGIPVIASTIVFLEAEAWTITAHLRRFNSVVSPTRFLGQPTI
nr:hypothetical protein Iba_scaffold2753CG0690 [Ipomoea batatas]GME21263.1 hypothetical protein Iba_scaffold27258CG0010 [Ipomoea batatas]